ncbi:P1 family peptidase [Brevibacillus sp. B_LB10_24]|uniref:DmpA family aminopeptidase n=1 Tax=Brevibacillus sp. B_LB10_24 TaxID=3380645 RepID=UPI0038B81802
MSKRDGSHQDEQQDIKSQIAEKEVSRREFLQKTALLGLTAAVPGSLFGLGTAMAADESAAGAEVQKKITGRVRVRELGIKIGRFNPGKWNAITDVPGVKVGYTTLISGEGQLVEGRGPVRTGVTVILPHDGNLRADPLFAAPHVLNGNGEMTGLAWVVESGLLTSPIGITNTHSVGVVRDALIEYDVKNGNIKQGTPWSLPVVAETYDGGLSDINGFHVKPEHVWQALESASDGVIAEGNVGGGTGMVCHGFKGGTGTSSRVLPESQGGWTVGVLVQANYGSKELLRVDGVPVGMELVQKEKGTAFTGEVPAEMGSIIIIVATNAPVIPTQCRRLAQRAGLGVARMGGTGGNGSGDIFLAFSTANRSIESANPAVPSSVKMLSHNAMSPLFEAVIEATEEAILNAMCKAETMTGANGKTVTALPLDDLVDIMKQYKRL